MTPDIQAVIHLQELDHRRQDLRNEIAALPKHIAEIEKALISHQRKLEADEAALAANEKERRKLEGDIKGFEQKISHLKDQMLQARTNEQYRAFQHEIEYAEREIGKAEDRILDLMGESEPLEENVHAAKVALAEEKKQVDRESEEARKRTQGDKDELARLQKEREQLVAGLDKRIYSIYERSRTKYHGVAVAEGTDGTCSACHLTMRPQFHQELKIGDKLMTCESCGRLLYYHASIDVAE